MKYVDLPGAVGKMPIVGYGTWQVICMPNLNFCFIVSFDKLCFVIRVDYLKGTN
jgi:hypothetical protein